MKVFKYITYQLSLIFYSIYLIGIKNLFNNYDRKSCNVLVVFPYNLRTWISYIIRAHVLHDLSILYFFCQNKISFAISFSPQFGAISKKNVFYSFSSLVNRYNFDNHSLYLFNLIKIIENNGNNVFPPSTDILFWENKINMHNEFDKFKINTPKTLIVNSFDYNIKEIEDKFSYPFLIKEPFSNHSKGIYYIEDSLKLAEQLSKSFNSVNSLLIQEVVSMTRDARVVVVNDQVVYSYWRNKLIGNGFTTTSTSNGSGLDFTPLLLKNQEILKNYTKKLNLTLAAYDVTFTDDNEQSDPIILEVSTSFLINPLPPKYLLNMPYYKFKSKALLFGILRAKAALNFKLNHLEISQTKKFAGNKISNSI